MAKHMEFESEVLLRGEQSGGRVAMVVNAAPAPWAGPPLHHHDFDETFYVLDGRLTFQLGDELIEAGPGTLTFAPRGSHHTLANLGDVAARYLVVFTPAGFERYFDRFAAERAGAEPLPEPARPIPETIVVGPPIGEAEAKRAAAAPSGERARVNVLLRSAGSANELAVMDNTIAAGSTGPPLHHHAFDEAFYVLDGELTFRLGDELLTRRRGELAFARGGADHAFANPSDADARTLIVCTPAGFERYFDRIAAREAGVDPPAEALEPWPEVITVGPRIGEPEEADDTG
ncbi:MAG: cupin domain-containing protein [Solirubrobacterales bacterium]|nr:cupin domain-containing protein [Solirubrobacterales bacterium]